MKQHELPVKAKEKNSDVPLIAVERWHKKDGTLQKKYAFLSPDGRNRFIIGLLDHERATNHHATMLVDADNVFLSLTTHDIGEVTELDKEYARFADVLYRDVVYDVMHAG